MIDIIYLAFNRLEFTKASMAAMLANTEWAKVRKLIVYDDGSTDGTREYLKSVDYPVQVEFVFESLGGPVAITNHYLSHSPSDVFAKIDNDTMLPPHWLGECMKVMESHKELDLLGIESFNPVKPGEVPRNYGKARHIGGIGLMRSGCFKTFPRANGRFGFTQWQRESSAIKGWINPSLPVFLLDKIAFDPWASLSRVYISKGWQRPWPPYDENGRAMWSWWTCKEK
ncbi:glycosyltransferase family 2 protein [bacterium]|nr:MAG: glycosyltransferase family 2 protein [bacterium]